MRQGTATVVKNAGSHFLLSELPLWQPFPAVLKGKVRLGRIAATNPVAVGDVVRYEMEEEGERDSGKAGRRLRSLKGSAAAQPIAAISEVLDRKNYIIRKSTKLSRQSHVIAANLDQAILAVSLFFPEIKLSFLDRLLVTCEVYGVKPLIVLNKVDLYRTEAPGVVEDFVKAYTGAGYRVLQTSCKTGEGIAGLKEACKGSISLISGESGVGKSSLIKALDKGLKPKIGRISLAHLQGKHTTSLYEMYPLSFGGFLIDSPGLRGFGLVDLKKEEIGLYFPEMLRAAKNCRFTPCTHTHEPGCAVKEAVERGEISAERYNSYLGMLEEDTKFRQ